MLKNWVCGLLSVFTTCCLCATEDSRGEIVNRLNQWSEDFNAKKSEAVCGLFAPDLVASYQGTPDIDYEEMCQKLTKILKQTETAYHYDKPQIEEILIKDDLAVVRLIWTLTLTDKDHTVIDRIQEKGLDVFRRQKGGIWKISVSYAYPILANQGLSTFTANNDRTSK